MFQLVACHAFRLAATLTLAFVFQSTAHADPCAPGSFSVDGQDPCTPCPAGTYSDSPGATGCAQCDPHTHSLAGASTCMDCPPRSYQPEAGSSTCVWRTDLSCWQVRDEGIPAEFAPMLNVAAADEISTDPVSLTRPSAFCSAATIESRPPSGHPESSMCCYKATGAKPATPVSFETTSILGGTLQLRVAKRALVCDQCQGGAETEPRLQCWKVRDLKNPKFSPYGGLRVFDRYSFDFLLVRKPALYCSPASVDGSPLIDTDAQRCCFSVGKAYVSGVSESVTGPLGEPLQLGVAKRSMICESCVSVPLP